MISYRPDESRRVTPSAMPNCRKTVTTSCEDTSLAVTITSSTFFSREMARISSMPPNTLIPRTNSVPAGTESEMNPTTFRPEARLLRNCSANRRASSFAPIMSAGVINNPLVRSQ